MHPAKAIEWSEMPFGKDSRVLPGNIVLDRVPSSRMGRGYLVVGAPVCSIAAYCQFTLTLVGLIVLWSELMLLLLLLVIDDV